VLREQDNEIQAVRKRVQDVEVMIQEKIAEANSRLVEQWRLAQSEEMGVHTAALEKTQTAFMREISEAVQTRAAEQDSKYMSLKQNVDERLAIRQRQMDTTLAALKDAISHCASKTEFETQIASLSAEFSAKIKVTKDKLQTVQNILERLQTEEAEQHAHVAGKLKDLALFKDQTSKDVMQCLDWQKTFDTRLDALGSMITNDLGTRLVNNEGHLDKVERELGDDLRPIVETLALQVSSMKGQLSDRVVNQRFEAATEDVQVHLATVLKQNAELTQQVAALRQKVDTVDEKSWSRQQQLHESQEKEIEDTWKMTTNWREATRRQLEAVELKLTEMESKQQFPVNATKGQGADLEHIQSIAGELEYLLQRTRKTMDELDAGQTVTSKENAMHIKNLESRLDRLSEMFGTKTGAKHIEMVNKQITQLEEPVVASRESREIITTSEVVEEKAAIASAPVEADKETEILQEFLEQQKPQPESQRVDVSAIQEATTPVNIAPLVSAIEDEMKQMHDSIADLLQLADQRGLEAFDLKSEVSATENPPSPEPAVLASENDSKATENNTLIQDAPLSDATHYVKTEVPVSPEPIEATPFFSEEQTKTFASVSDLPEPVAASTVYAQDQAAPEATLGYIMTDVAVSPPMLDSGVGFFPEDQKTPVSADEPELKPEEPAVESNAPVSASAKPEHKHESKEKSPPMTPIPEEQQQSPEEQRKTIHFDHLGFLTSDGDATAEIVFATETDSSAPQKSPVDIERKENEPMQESAPSSAEYLETEAPSSSLPQQDANEPDLLMTAASPVALQMSEASVDKRSETPTDKPAEETV